MKTKKEICGSTAYLVKDVPLILDVYGYVYSNFYGYVNSDRQYILLEVAKCELPKGHTGRHSTSKVTDFFKSIEW